MRLSDITRKVVSCFIVFLFLAELNALQFGNENDLSSTVFIKVQDDVRDVYLASYATYIIKNDNTLWGTGEGVNRQFGIDGPVSINTFQKLMDNVYSYDGIYLVKTDGTVWKTDKGVSRVNEKVKKGAYGLFLTEDNNLWAVGTDRYGHFGTGKKNITYQTPELVMSDILDFYTSMYCSQVINLNHELLISGTNYLPAPYAYSTSFFKIADNVRYTTQGFYITDSDELYAFGWCGCGTSGLGDIQGVTGILPTKVMENVLSVSSNQQVSLFLLNNGDVYGCGGDTPNYEGELGLGNKDPVFIPTFIMSDAVKVYTGYCCTAVIKKDGTLWMCGGNNSLVGGY